MSKKNDPNNPETAIEPLASEDVETPEKSHPNNSSFSRKEGK